MQVIETNAAWLDSERAAEAAWREQSAQEAASARQLREAKLHAKRVNKAQRRREADRPWGFDSIATVLVVLFVVSMLIAGIAHR